MVMAGEEGPRIADTAGMGAPWSSRMLAAESRSPCGVTRVTPAPSMAQLTVRLTFLGRIGVPSSRANTSPWSVHALPAARRDA